MKDLHALPKVRDSWSYLYVEHCVIDQDQKAITLHDKRGKVPVPCASLAALFLGPGTSITHAAIRTLADCGCLVSWVGEESVRFYAQGMGETRSSRRLLHQAKIWSDAQTRMQVVRRMYEMRFSESLDPALTFAQIRGKEGMRVREAYSKASAESGIVWSGRSYKRDKWEGADCINRALSAANSCLYGVCHAAIVSAGYSPALGFIHTGKMLSFVYDIADLYKTETTVPVAFRSTAEGPAGIETRVRQKCRDLFHSTSILQRIVPDIERVLQGEGVSEDSLPDFDLSDDPPGGLWDPKKGEAIGGVNWADDDQEDKSGSHSA